MPRPVRFELGVVREAFTGQSQRVQLQLEATADEQFALSTRLEGWTVGVLVAHLSLAVGAFARWVAAPEAVASGHTLSSYYEAGRTSAAIVDDMSRAAAADRTAHELRQQFAAAVAAATDAVANVEADRVLQTRIGAVPVTDSVATRCVEVVVHALDLQHATGVPAARGDAASPAALGVCVKVVAAVLQERAPGHSVEIRVPGRFGTAFQCGDGPQHTRGTPPNVIETDAVTFVELGAGRLSWAQALAAGSVRASGLRADLSALLPALG